MTGKHRNPRRLLFSLILALSLCLTGASPASAQDLSEYFQLGYNPVTFDKSEINGSEVFYATVSGRAVCTEDLPIAVSEASLTSRVIAVHAASGTEVTLNPSYTLNIKPFPSKKGETADISQAVPLQFPAAAASGDYNIIGKIVEAKVKILVWVPVTEFLPQEQPMGTVKYTASEPAAIPENPPPPEPLPGPPPLKSTPSASSIPPGEALTPPPAASGLTPWWVWVVVGFAGASIIMNIILLSRRRAG